MLSKLKMFAALCGAFFIAIGIAVLKGRADGARHMESEQQRERDALQYEYNRIDAGPVDPGRAYDGLRKRSGWTVAARHCRRRHWLLWMLCKRRAIAL